MNKRSKNQSHFKKDFHLFYWLWPDALWQEVFWLVTHPFVWWGGFCKHSAIIETLLSSPVSNTILWSAGFSVTFPEKETTVLHSDLHKLIYCLFKPNSKHMKLFHLRQENVHLSDTSLLSFVFKRDWHKGVDNVSIHVQNLGCWMKLWRWTQKYTYIVVFT